MCRCSTPRWAPTDTARSDARENLRRHFEVDQCHVTQAALAGEGKMTPKDVKKAIGLYKIDSEKPNPPRSLATEERKCKQYGSVKFNKV